MQVFICCEIALHVSGVHRTHRQEYIKLYLQPLVQVIVSEQRPVPEDAVTVLCSPDDGCDGHPKHVESDFTVNKYLH